MNYEKVCFGYLLDLKIVVFIILYAVFNAETNKKNRYNDIKKYDSLEIKKGKLQWNTGILFLI